MDKNLNASVSSLPLEERRELSKKMTSKYPDKVPVIIEKTKDKADIDIDKRKYLVPHELTVSQFIYTIRKRIKLKSEQAIFMFFGNNMVNTSMIMSEVYKYYRNKEDNLLYATISAESTFG